MFHMKKAKYNVGTIDNMICCPRPLKKKAKYNTGTIDNTIHCPMPRPRQKDASRSCRV